MKLVFAICIICIIASIHFASALPRAEAEADPEPLVGTKIANTCKESMGDASSHKVLCRKAADHVVEKVAKVCHKAVKYGCRLASFAIKFESCYEKLINLLCPAQPPETIQVLDKPTTDLAITEAANDQPPTDFASDDHPSWIGRFVMRRCDQHLKPIADNITANGQAAFNSNQFCKELGRSGKETCLATLVGSCEGVPDDWVKVKAICKDYVVPWICK